MICPFCAHDGSKVVDSRDVGEAIRRRRECDACARRYSTLERLDRRLPQVVKKDGVRQVFDREKVRAGLQLACRKRPVTSEQIEQAAAFVEAQAFTEAERGEIAATRVGDLVLQALQDLDPVAFLRFASVYHELQSPEQFLELIQPLLQERQT